MRLDRHSKEVQAPQCDQQTQRTTARGNERTFREKLSQQTGAGSAQRCSDAKFLTSRGGPGQEQGDLDDLRATFSIILAAGGAVLPIPRANLGNLLLARASSRRQVLGLPAALGASLAR